MLTQRWLEKCMLDIMQYSTIYITYMLVAKVAEKFFLSFTLFLVLCSVQFTLRWFLYCPPNFKLPEVVS